MFLYEHQNHLLHLPILYTSPFHPGVQRNQPETKHRSSISDQHQYKRLGLTDSPSEEERPPLEQEEIPPVGTQVWFPPRQHPNKTLFEFCNHPTKNALLLEKYHSFIHQQKQDNLLVSLYQGLFLTIYMGTDHLFKSRKIFKDLHQFKRSP